MRKLLFILFISVAFANCNVNHDDYRVFKEVSVALKDSLAVVTMKIPIAYDTFAKWRSDDGCTNTGTLCYRFQPKLIKLYLESGFIYIGEPNDSIENITIKHAEILNNNSNITTKNFYDLHKSSIKNYNQSHSGSDTINLIKYDTIKIINDQLFSIIIVDDFDSYRNEYYKKAMATTEYKGNFIDFVCIKKTKINDASNINFISNSLKIFESIKFSNQFNKK